MARADLSAPPSSRADDGSWCLCNDYDLPMTFFGGPEAAVDGILADDSIEAFRVEPTTRTDSSGDTVNGGGEEA